MFRPLPMPEGVSGTLQLPWRFQVQNPLTDNQEKAGGFPPAHACPPVEAPPAPLTGIFFTGQISGAGQSGIRQSPGAGKGSGRSAALPGPSAGASPRPMLKKYERIRRVTSAARERGPSPLPQRTGEPPLPA